MDRVRKHACTFADCGQRFFDWRTLQEHKTKHEPEVRCESCSTVWGETLTAAGGVRFHIPREKHQRACNLLRDAATHSFPLDYAPYCREHPSEKARASATNKGKPLCGSSLQLLLLLRKPQALPSRRRA